MAPSKLSKLIPIEPFLQGEHKQQKSKNPEHKCDEILVSYQELLIKFITFEEKHQWEFYIGNLVSKDELSQLALEKFAVEKEDAHREEVPILN